MLFSGMYAFIQVSAPSMTAQWSSCTASGCSTGPPQDGHGDISKTWDDGAPTRPPMYCDFMPGNRLKGPFGCWEADETDCKKYFQWASPAIPEDTLQQEGILEQLTIIHLLKSIKCTSSNLLSKWSSPSLVLDQWSSEYTITSDMSGPHDSTSPAPSLPPLSIISSSLPSLSLPPTSSLLHSTSISPSPDSGVVTPSGAVLTIVFWYKASSGIPLPSLDVTLIHIHAGGTPAIGHTVHRAGQQSFRLV
ncbi:hypothetical protein K439DRAFT_1612929 [Ramaria rubella]|nr:hypothetical protein K439DRAFT_1612929 [Ramaria rubella]